MKKHSVAFLIIICMLITSLTACGNTISTTDNCAYPGCIEKKYREDLCAIHYMELLNAQSAATNTPEPQITDSLTSAPTDSINTSSTPEPTATSTPEPTATSTPEPTATSTPEPTATPKPTATPTPTATPKPTATPTPTATPKPTATPTPTATPKFSEEDVLKKLKVTGEYEYNDSWGWNHKEFVSVKNTSTFTIELIAKIKFYDKNGNLIGYDSDSIHAVGPNEEVLLSFSNDETFDHYDITWSASEEKYYSAVCSNVTIDITKTNGKAIIEATNKGNVAAQFVEYYALFFNGEDVVGYDWGYLTDSDSEIKPGKSEMREANIYNSFDSVKVFINGRGKK